MTYGDLGAKKEFAEYRIGLAVTMAVDDEGEGQSLRGGQCHADNAHSLGGAYSRSSKVR